jgi:PAS domain S-box-containing protein
MMLQILLSSTTVALTLISTVLVYRLGSIFGDNKVTKFISLAPFTFAGYAALPLFRLTSEPITQNLWPVLALFTISLVMTGGLVYLRQVVLEHVSVRQAYDQMLDTISDIYYVTNLDGLLEYISPSAVELFGFSMDEAIGSPMASHYAPDALGINSREAFLKAMQEGGGSVRGYQANMKRKDGSIFPIETNASFRKTMGGKICGVQGIARDISARVETERMNTVLSQVVEDSLTEIYVCDSGTNKFISVNSAARKNLGYDMKELLNLTPVALIPSLSDAALNARKRVLRDGKQGVHKRESIHRRKDGSEYPVELTLQHANSGKSSVLVAHAQDLTLRREAEASLVKVERLRSAARLTGGVAHEFNNMLQVLQLNIELIETTQDKDHTYQTDALRVIARAAQLNLQLLGYSRQLNLAPMNVDANNLLLTLPDELRGKLDSSIDLKTLPCVDLPAIYIDRNQLKGCLLNLSMNALLAMPNGGSLTLQSSIKTSPLTDTPSDDATYVKLSVIDTGIGMSQEVRDQAVEPFFTTREVGQGPGLGLSMVHGFVNQSGGHMLISSSPAQGTRVDLYFPAIVI